LIKEEDEYLILNLEDK